MTTEPIKVTGEMLPDPDTCRFTVNRVILENETLAFDNADESRGSPLIDSVFAVPGITRVRVSGNTLTLSKNVPTPWPELAKDLLPAIRNPLESEDRPSLSGEALEAAGNRPPADDTRDAVEQLLEQHINPALSMHGGFVKLIRVENDNVYLELGGGCQGCAASKMTLKHGVERAIRDVAPQVRDVIDVTDHTAGTNPYYR